MKVAVFGLGYVGTVTAAGLASRGHDVVGVDVDAVKVGLIRAGPQPGRRAGHRRPGRRRRRSAAACAPRRTPPRRWSGADVSLLCVGTPSTPAGEHRPRATSRAPSTDIRDAMDVAAPPASGFHAVVVRSTVPPGTGATGRGAPSSPTCPRTRAGRSARRCAPSSCARARASRTSSTRRSSSSARRRPAPARRAHRAVRLPRPGAAPRRRRARAEALKYACNAFHATKVSFANEMGRVFRAYGVDAREVMEIFCEDRMLNISPTYLRPGFAFGGSCLPKDLRALQHMARANDVDVPLLGGTLRSNELVVRDVVDRVLATAAAPGRLLGLSFKMDTDDLRESPNVELAERLLGKGFDVRIYDPIINPDRLIGRQPALRRGAAAAPEPPARRHARGGARRAPTSSIVASSDPAVAAPRCATPPPELIIDLHGRLGAEVERLPGYEGVGW